MLVRNSTKHHAACIVIAITTSHTAFACVVLFCALCRFNACRLLGDIIARLSFQIRILQSKETHKGHIYTVARDRAGFGPRCADYTNLGDLCGALIEEVT